jgi:hypothetical protein
MREKAKTLSPYLIRKIAKHNSAYQPINETLIVYFAKIKTSENITNYEIRPK